MGEEFGSSLVVILTQDYEIVEPLGRGASSYVYRVKNRLNGLEYGLKVVDKAQLKRPLQLQRLLTEITLQKSLSHPNILRLYHSFEDSDSHYLVLEFCPGGELFHYIKTEGRLKEETAAMLCGQLVEGLAYLHSNHIIHRDLKLGNLLLNEEATELKIADFGLAKRLESRDAESATICGTPNYISP